MTTRTLGAGGCLASWPDAVASTTFRVIAAGSARAPNGGAGGPGESPGPPAPRSDNWARGWSPARSPSPFPRQENQHVPGLSVVSGRTRDLTSRMPESGTYGSVGGVG